MVRSKMVILLIIVGAIINPVLIHAEHPYTEPTYVNSEKVGTIIQVPETNDDKANLEPIPLNQVRGDLGGLTNSYTAYGLGFSTKGDNDYFLFQPQLLSDIETSYIWARFDTYFYTVNPQNGTWIQFSLETINGTVEIQVQVEVARNPHTETLDAVIQYNHTEKSGSAYGRNFYAIWRNNNDSIATSPKAYKNESGVISLASTGSSTGSIIASFNDTSTSLSDTFSWRVSKFYVSVIFSVNELPLQAYLNDVFLKISSPLNLTFNYDFMYGLYAKPTTARLDFPIHYFLFAFIPLALVLLRRKLKKVE